MKTKHTPEPGLTPETAAYQAGYEYGGQFAPGADVLPINLRSHPLPDIPVEDYCSLRRECPGAEDETECYWSGVNDALMGGIK